MASREKIANLKFRRIARVPTDAELEDQGFLVKTRSSVTREARNNRLANFISSRILMVPSSRIRRIAEAKMTRNHSKDQMSMGARNV